MEATARSYAPYSHFSAGAAALLNNGTIVTGTNQENANLPVGTLCGTYYPVLCQLAVSRPTGKYSRYRSKNRKGLYRNSYSSLWRLPPSDSGNGKRYGQPIRILLYGRECIYEVKSIGDLLPLSFDASAMEE